MPTFRESILSALHSRLSALPATALRGDVLPERVPAAGLVILRDGEPGEPDVTLSPLAYHYQHRAEIEAVVQAAARDAAFDTLTASIGTALAADRTLGGLCDWVEAESAGSSRRVCSPTRMHRPDPGSRDGVKSVQRRIEFDDAPTVISGGGADDLRVGDAEAIGSRDVFKFAGTYPPIAA